MTTKKTKLRAVIVRAYSGVFFGYLVSKKGASVELKVARQIWSWDSAGMAEKAMTCGDIARIGLGAGSKVSGPADAIIEQVGAVFVCTGNAVNGSGYGDGSGSGSGSGYGDGSGDGSGYGSGS